MSGLIVILVCFLAWLSDKIILNTFTFIYIYISDFRLNRADFYFFSNIYFLLNLFLDAPSAPLEPTIASITADSATLTWAAPTRDGGSAVTGYIVERKDPYTARWTPIERCTDTNCKISGLKEGNEYQFRVLATNKAGQSAPSNPSQPKVAKSPYGKFHRRKALEN